MTTAETNTKDENWLTGHVEYSPAWINCDEDITGVDVGQATLYKYDGLFTMFVEPAGDITVLEDDEFNLDKKLARLINARFNDEYDTSVVYNTQPSWTTIRDRAVTLTGLVIHNVGLFTRHLVEISDDTIYLDASAYQEKDSEVNYFGGLMALANSTKTVVEDYLAKHLNARDTIDFLNAAPGDQIVFMNKVTTKWLVEGQILNEELIKLQAFQRNFNRLVITGVPKAVGKGGLNLNALYQLFAKLGRINTKILLLD